jgi:ElaB/YqjD/DUF883 family membrane-anchored ribosome-binding protein
MAYDLSEVKSELNILIENIDRLMQYEDNTDISEEIRSRVQVSLLEAQTALDQLEDEIDDGLYERDAPLYYDDEDDEDEGDLENSYY